MRGNARWLLTCALLVAVCASSADYNPVRASTPAYIDKTLFTSTVPTQMVLGGGYSVQVGVVNNSTGVEECVVQLVYPQQYFFSDRPTQTLVLQPGDNGLLVFDLVAANPHLGAMNVSAVLIVNGTHGSALAYTASTTVYSISRSKFVNDLPYYAIAALLTGGGLWALATLLRKGERGQ